MPTVFQTGESVPRPIDPDRLYYTTAQKVGDLLQIPFPDGVSLTADSSTNSYVLISPTDHRHTGFEVDDKVEIASEGTMGEEAYVASIVASGTDIRLNLKDAAGATYSLTQNHTTALYATVQNLQSFTNGKRRGVTKTAVQTLIKRTQDKLDNLTNNSWRPMLQTAEYVNFDTYKPYRRRYYTDYVGTAPLRFRNVQQILRLEIWQGQEYREVGAAEARVTVLDQSALSTADYVYLCPGGGGVASLQVGTGTGNWRADFDDSSTAQNLADLINKDFNRNKSEVAISPSFSLEDVYGTGGLTTAKVHHEFLASANADYGAGQIKITSMSRGEGGQNATIATTNLDGLSCGNVNNPTTTIRPAAFLEGTVTAGGTGYTGGTGVATTGGTGTGLTVNTTVGAGAVTAVAVNAGGTGYTVDDVITVSGGGGDATFTITRIDAVVGTTLTVTSTEGFAPYGILYTGSGSSIKAAYYTGITPTITDANGVVTSYGTFTGLTDLAPSGCIEAIEQGGTVNQYRMKIDYVGTTTGDEARLRDWWMDYELGIIYFNNTYPYFEWNAVKVTYVHGERYVEKAIEDIATKLVAMDLLISDDRTVLLPEGTSNIDLGSKYQLLKQQVAETLPRYVEVLDIL